MALQTLKQALRSAEAGGYAVGSFNVSDLNQAIAVLEAAQEQRSPVILQAIVGMSAYSDEHRWWTQLRSIVESYSEVPTVLHLDHGRTHVDCLRAIEHGFTSVMIDASRTVGTDAPASLQENIDITAGVVAVAHPASVSVEGEVGTIGGAETEASGMTEEIIFTDPGQAQDFVRLTQVDALAVAVGTSHGAVKFTDPEGAASLQIELIAKIKDLLPDTYLVLHGASSIPAQQVCTINAYGGSLPASYGIDTEQKQAGIRTGIRKINQGTDSHLAWTAAARESLALSPSVVEPSIATKAGLSAMRDIVALRMREFGSAGQAGAR